MGTTRVAAFLPGALDYAALPHSRASPNETISLTPRRKYGRIQARRSSANVLSRKIRPSLFVTLLMLFCLVFSSPLPSLALGSTTRPDDSEAADESVGEGLIEFSSPSTTTDLINFDIFEDIARARAVLEGRRCGFHVVKMKRVGRAKKARWKRKQRQELGEFDILLAVENVKTREIQIARVDPKLGTRSENIIVEPGKSNGVNTKFTILYPEHHVVLALKRPVRRGATFREVIYTPYSDALDIPAVRNAGLEYLKSTIDGAKWDLTRRGSGRCRATRLPQMMSP